MTQVSAVTGVKGSQVQILSSRQKNPKPAGLGSLISGFGEGHWDEH
jgi:predicted DNA-binding transcriptional regulator AlpA